MLYMHVFTSTLQLRSVDGRKPFAATEPRGHFDSVYIVCSAQHHPLAYKVKKTLSSRVMGPYPFDFVFLLVLESGIP